MKMPLGTNVYIVSLYLYVSLQSEWLFWVFKMCLRFSKIGLKKIGRFSQFEVFLTGHSQSERPHRCVSFATAEADHKSMKFSAR